MTRESIEDFREIILPFVKKKLLEINYEGLGKSDAEMFAKDFNEIINLASKAIEQDPILDKIRAEMFEEMQSHSGTGEEVIQAYADGLKKGLDILDKYKVEFEAKDKVSQG